MAAGSFTLYNSAKEYLISTFQWGTTNFYAALLKGAYTPAATHDQWGDVSAQVCTDADYNEVALAGADVLPTGAGLTTDATKNVDANDVDYGSTVTISAKYLVVVSGTPTTPGATDKLLGYVNLETTGTSANEVSSTNGDFQVQWNANGLFTVA